MSQPLTISRVSELPAELSANTIYIAKSATPGKVELYFTGNEPGTVLSTLTHTEVEAIIADKIEDAIEAAKSVFIYPDFESMVSESFEHSVLAYVEDTSNDPLAQTPTGAYVFDPVNNSWIPLPSGKSEINWEEITSKPQSSPEEIDAAVNASHTHANMDVLEKFGESNDGLTFNGKLVQNIAVVSNW